MDNTPRPTLHPMIWIASAAVILFAGVGTAHFLGLLPGKSEPQIAVPVAAETVPTPAAATVAPAPMAAAAPMPAAPAPVQKKPHKPIAAAQVAPPMAPVSSLPPPPPVSSPAPCRECGTIESVRQVVREGTGSGLGAVAGGVLGGALGHGVGQGTGRDLATIAGAVGGAVLGNKVEKSQKTSSSWETTVRFEDGTSRLVPSEAPPAWRAGDRVKVVNGAIVPR